MTSTDTQQRIWELEDTEQQARHLRDRALDLAIRLTAGFPARPLPPLADRAVRLALALHYRAEAAESALENFLNHLERDGR
jgi:hypothetical protein